MHPNHLEEESDAMQALAKTTAHTQVPGLRPSPRPPSVALSTSDLEVSYPNGTRALLRSSVAFETGSFNVLLGASGAGKSTLLRCLNGLVTPTGGRVHVEGIGALDNRSALRLHRRRTGMVFQQHHLIGRLSVLTNVLMGRLGYHHALATLRPWSRDEKERALAAIERVGLLDRALDRADQLSGGQQQRVGVARALVQQPRILLADEPVASLDPATAEHLLTLMHDICRRDGLTAVVSLHQVDLARRFADRIIGLKGGAICFDGTPAELSSEAAIALYEPNSSSRSASPAPASPFFLTAGAST